MGITVTILVVTCIIFCAYELLKIYMRNRRLYQQFSEFDGPIPLPFVGNAHLFAGNGEVTLNMALKLAKSYASPFRVWFGQVLCIVLTEPEQIKEVCLSPKAIEKGGLYIFFRPWIGTGLGTAPASKWRVHRKLIQPTFNPRILNNFVEAFATLSKVLTDQMERHLDGPEFRVFNIVTLCTLDMLCETAMGVKIKAQTSSNCYYTGAVQTVQESTCRRIFTFWLYPDCIFNRTQLGKGHRSGIKFMHDFADNVIRSKKHKLLELNRESGTSDNNDNIDDPAVYKREVFLDQLLKLLKNGKKFTDEELREEVDTMIMAGQDSTATTNTFVMLMLASHPDIQEKVYQELFEIYGNESIEEREVRHEDLSRMNYLERVIKETMRLFPLLPIIFRTVTDDLTIGDHTIPKGSTAGLGIYRIHRSEKYWQDPLKFDPDRFLPEEVAKRHPYTYMAFSGGPRNCIGMRYAMMAMKTLQATVLRKYILMKDDIVPVKDIRVKIEVVLKPVNPIKIRIERRSRD